MTPKEYLEQIKKLDCLIENKLSEKQSVYDMVTNVTATMTGMPHAPGVSDKIGNGVSKLIDLEHEIDELIDKYVDKKREVQNIIVQLPANQYHVLYKHYFEYKTHEQIAEETHYSERHVRRLIEEGLQLLCPIMSLNNMI